MRPGRAPAWLPSPPASPRVGAVVPGRAHPRCGRGCSGVRPAGGQCNPAAAAVTTPSTSCFNKLKNWRGIAVRSDKTVRNYHAVICLTATLTWINSGLTNTPWSLPKPRGEELIAQNSLVVSSRRSPLSMSGSSLPAQEHSCPVRTDDRRVPYDLALRIVDSQSFQGLRM